MNNRKAVWYGVLLLLLGNPLWGEGDTPSVILVNADPPRGYSWVGSMTYEVFDDDMKSKVSVISEGGYTKVYVLSRRNLTIRLVSTSVMLGWPVAASKAAFTVTPDMAGKVFAITRSTGFSTTIRISVVERSIDIAPLVYCPDRTGTLTLGSREATPYETTYGLLANHPEQTATISAAALTVASADRMVLYGQFKADDRLAGLNGFPGLGWGSFRQGDWIAGTVFFAGDLGAQAFTMGSGLGVMANAIVYPFTDQKDLARRNIRELGGIFFISIGSLIAVKIAAVGWANLNTAGHDSRLSTALGLTPAGAVNEASGAPKAAP